VSRESPASTTIQPTGSRGWKIGLLASVILLVGTLHFVTRTGDPALHAWHIFFRKLFFIPLLAGAVWYCLRGALLTAVGVIGVYVLHLVYDWPRLHWERMNQVGEIVSFVLFAIVAGTLMRLEQRTRERAELQRRQAERDKLHALVRSLSETLGARDADTQEHSRRVASMAGRFGRHLRLPHEAMQDLYLAGLLHDIGKVGIRDDILHKPDALNPEERARVMEHPRIAERILAPGGFAAVSHAVAAHHENWDGSGYPAGLAGNAIPLPARILAIVDCYDALASERPYHHGLEAVGEIRSIMDGMSGQKLDPGLLAQFWTFLEHH